jgi:hypothetical protein
LKTPTPGAPRPQDADAATQAQRVLGGTPKSAAATQGELELLAASGATKADPNIRQELRTEVIKQGKRKSYSDTVLFWRGRKGDSGTPARCQRGGGSPRLAGPRDTVDAIAGRTGHRKGNRVCLCSDRAGKKAAEKESSGGWFNWF